MTLDDQLRRAFETLAARLREDVAAHAVSAVEEVIATAEAERAEAVAQAVRDAWAAAERDVAGRLTATRAEAEAQVRAEFETDEHAARDRMLGAIRSMDRAESLSEILDVLVSSASAEAARAGILLCEGDRLRSWRCAGFGARLNDSGALTLSLADGGIVADAAETGYVASAGGSSPSEAPAFADLPQGRRAVAVPLQMSGQVFAVLYADQGPLGDSRNDAWPAATLEVLARHAARSLEAVTAYRLSQVEARV